MRDGEVRKKLRSELCALHDISYPRDIVLLFFPQNGRIKEVCCGNVYSSPETRNVDNTYPSFILCKWSVGNDQRVGFDQSGLVVSHEKGKSSRGIELSVIPGLGCHSYQNKGEIS